MLNYFRGYEEMVKRAPSMDLQLATILLKNSSNLTMDQVIEELEESEPYYKRGKSLEALNETTIRNSTVYARPTSRNTKSAYGALAVNSSRPVSQSQSESNLYYADIRPNNQQTSHRSSPANSFLSVQAEV